MTFNDEDSLFQRIEIKWNSIPPKKIHNLFESFCAPYLQYIELNGKSLNEY